MFSVSSSVDATVYLVILLHLLFSTTFSSVPSSASLCVCFIPVQLSLRALPWTCSSTLHFQHQWSCKRKGMSFLSVQSLEWVLPSHLASSQHWLPFLLTVETVHKAARCGQLVCSVSKQTPLHYILISNTFVNWLYAFVIKTNVID